MKGLSATGTIVGATLVLFASSAQAAWYITDLGESPAFNSSNAKDINDSGQIVGSVLLTNNSPSFSPYVYDKGVLTILDQSDRYSSATAINARGQIVGGGNYNANNEVGYLYDQGNLRSLPTLGAAYNAPAAINNQGQVTGTGYVNGNFVAYLSNGDSSIQNIGTLPGMAMSIGTGINNAGAVTGYSYSEPGGETHSFVYANGKMQDIGSLGGSYTYAQSINDAGQVVGYASVGPGYDSHAFLYSDSKMTDLAASLGNVHSSAYDINDHGQVVGTYAIGNNMVTAFLYDKGNVINLGALQEVIAAGWTNLQAFAINNLGDIVGIGEKGITTHAFVLSPNQQFAAPTVVGLRTFLAPEIDGGSATLGIALLGGLLAFVRPKKSASA